MVHVRGGSHLAGCFRTAPENERMWACARAEQVRELQKASKALQHKVQLLEALRIEHEALLEQAQAAPPHAAAVVPGAEGARQELPETLLEALAVLCDVADGGAGAVCGIEEWVGRVNKVREGMKSREAHAERLMDKITELESWRAEHFAGQHESTEVQALLAAAQKAADT